MHERDTCAENNTTPELLENSPDKSDAKRGVQVGTLCTKDRQHRARKGPELHKDCPKHVDALVLGVEGEGVLTSRHSDQARNTQAADRTAHQGSGTLKQTTVCTRPRVTR